MDTFVDFVSKLIYGTGSEEVMPAPNHRDWLAAHPAPTGVEWMDHYVDRLLPAFEAWLASQNLPPITAWDGTRPALWDATQNISLPSSLDGSFTGIATVEALGTALKNRYTTVSGAAAELSGLQKAPFGFRFWGYMKWAQQMRAKFFGEIVVPPVALYDRDGTPLSAVPFVEIYNQCHRSWHVDPTPATGPTPGLLTSAGQIARSGGVGMASGEEFIKFHHDHNEIFFRWLERLNQPAVRSINMSQGWPPPAQTANNPSTWTEPDSDPWINTENGDADNHLNALTSVDQIGNQIGGYHVAGHGTNTDIGPLSHNNHVPRFFAWHGSIDSQWFWREPRFASTNATTGLRERTFRPVLSTSADWPGLQAVTIVRDPAAVADVISPANAVSGLDLATGVGTLRMKFLAKDSYDRNLTLRLRADVFNDAVSTVVPVETIPESSNTYTIGTGGNFPLDTEFTVDFTFASAFQSDDPTRANPAVGFVNSRIRITGTMEVAGGGDPGFIHRDFTDLRLVQEKQAPEINLYLDLSSFGEDQVNAAMSGSEARFSKALIVIMQDRTSNPATITWPAAVVDEVKGLLTGWIPAAGLFDAPYKPDVVIWRDTVDAPFTGLTVELASGPIKEDPALPDNLPQRHTYFFDVVFTTGHDAFDLLAMGASRQARLRVEAVDRAGNKALEQMQIKLFRAENPFMRDGDPSWLSIDTRVFSIFAGDQKFDGLMLNAGQPNTFVQDVLSKLNDTGIAQATRDAYFDDLPENQNQSVLEYSTQVTDHSTGTSRQIYNFALAKVRLQGANGAANVRAFFRLFRYTASNLIFDDVAGYRFHTTIGGDKLPLLGFTAAGETVSVPFFAEPRVPYATAMTAQTDPLNVRTFPAGPTEERVLYFGVYLDINQSGAQLPATRIVAHPDGAFLPGEVQPIRSLMLDAHQCMVVEIKYDGDPTEPGATPANSDNLAQRNLLILYTDNPGAPLTHTVQHSFEADLGCCRPDQRPVPLHHAVKHGEHDHDNGHNHSHEDHDHGAPFLDAERASLRFITAAHREKLIREEAVSLAMSTPRNGNHAGHHHDLEAFFEEAAKRVDRRFPFVFDGARWQSTGAVIDELLFIWNDLPRASRVELYLPGVRAESVLNLRHLRHAPGDVKIIDEHTLLLTPDGVSYIPLPPTVEERVAGIVTIILPEGIRKRQNWQIDVVQIRGAERRTTGGFQIDIQVSEASLIADGERRLLELMFERLSLTSKQHRWHPILTRRVNVIRERAKALAESARIVWTDPTTWIDPQHPDHPRPVEGQRIRVVLDRIEILEDRDPWIKGRGEIVLQTRVLTTNNGGSERRLRFPQSGVYKVSDRPGQNVVVINQEIFSGYVANDLQIEMIATEQDTFDPDDTVGKYTRLFCGTVGDWIGNYVPGDEPIDPEDMVAWRVWYRIERV